MAKSSLASSGVSLSPSRWRELHPRVFFLETWRDLDREAESEKRNRGEGYDWRPLVVFALGGVCLTLMEYFGGGNTFERVLRAIDEAGAHSPLARQTIDAMRANPYRGLFQYCWWSGWRVLGYFLIPAISIWCMGGRIRDYGLSTRGFLEHAWIYVFFYVIVLGCVVVVSFSPSFANYYPFYKQAQRSWSDLVLWELLYAAQFFSLEFFFRGYWLQACKRTMGSAAIFAMIVPYCMIHYGKPWLEAIAAIFAGVVLGTLALRTRSIWSGFLIHVSVALSMDLAALMQTTGLPDRWLP